MTTSLDETLRVMQPEGIGAVLVCDGEKLVGIFTERDVLFKLFGDKVDFQQPIEKFMTRDPKVLSTEDTLGDAVQLMTESGYRNIPLQDEQGRRAGMITTREIIKYVAEHFPAEVVNLPPPDQTFQAPEGA
jgi:CBS domain-containing protein